MSKTLANILSGLVRLGTAPLRPQRRDIVAAMVARGLVPVPEVETSHGTLRFWCPDRQALEYPRELLTREPDTIAWIDSFAEGEVFWDIGANVGAYALYAALATRGPVLAFEPAAASFAALARNVEINGLDDRVKPFCVALAGRTAIETLNMAHTYASSVMHVLGGDGAGAAFRQAVPAFAVDDFVRLFDPPLPNHVKIDVDGPEPDIVAGGTQVLSDAGVKSVLVEVGPGADPARARPVAAALERLGFVPAPPAQGRPSNNRIFRRGI